MIIRKLITIFLLVLGTSSIASEFNNFNGNTNYLFLKTSYPEIYKKIEEVQKLKTTNKATHTIILLVSNSIPLVDIENFITEASILNYYYDIKVQIVLQGIYSKEFQFKIKSILNSFDTYLSSELFIKNMNVVIDPKIFTSLKIKKVPIIIYAKCINNSCYPSDTEIKYLSKGTQSVSYFMKTIAQFNKDNRNNSNNKGGDFEIYYNTINSAK
jgi:protein associated with RNAse G/E